MRRTSGIRGVGVTVVDEYDVFEYMMHTGLATEDDAAREAWHLGVEVCSEQATGERAAEFLRRRAQWEEDNGDSEEEEEQQGVLQGRAREPRKPCPLPR